MLKLISTEKEEALLVYFLRLCSQVSQLSDCIFHIIRSRTRDDGSGVLINLFREHAKTELGDAIQQIRKICGILGISFDEADIIGLKREKERREEFTKKHPREVYI